MSKRKKPSAAPEASAGEESVTTRAAVSQEVMEQARGVVESSASEASEVAPLEEPVTDGSIPLDPEMTVNLVGDLGDFPIPGRDDLDAPTVSVDASELAGLDGVLAQRKHLRGLLEALIFASDGPIKERELAKLASANAKQIRELLVELSEEYGERGINIEEVAGGWVMRTSVQYAPFVRDLTKQKPVKLTRAQVETLAIIAYRQPITRPEMDDVRGVDSGPVLKLLLERDLIRILGKRDEPGRPLIYGTTQGFLEFFGLKSLKDLPTLREFTELSDESRDVYEAELGEPPNGPGGDAATVEVAIEDIAHSTQPDLDEAQPDGRAPHESMRVPIGEQPISQLGPDDLEVVSDFGQNEDAHDVHDHEDTTLTSEAPPPPDPEDEET